MNTKDILRQLRVQKGLSQDELAEKLYVTRQAVSRWETGETTPNVETLKLLSRFFDVSINTLLGTPRALVCQCCGMPLDDASLSRELDGAFNEDYCKWCYHDGTFLYESKEQLIDFCVEHMATETWPKEQVRAHMEAVKRRLKEEKNAKDEDVLVSLQLVNEMLVRGYEFLPIELGKSRGSKYVVEDGKVRLPFCSLKGLGGAAADALENVTIHGEEYLSIEELQQASGVGSSIIDRLRQVGALGELPESSQVSFF